MALVFIPKERDATRISQFRPISVLNVEGKIFFSIIAQRLSTYLLKNGFIDTSVHFSGHSRVLMMLRAYQCYLATNSVSKKRRGRSSM